MAALIAVTLQDDSPPSTSTTFGEISEFVEFLGRSASDVQKVQIRNVQLSIEDLDAIQQVLGTHHRNLHLKSLEVSQDSIDSSGASDLAQIISFQKETLETIDLSQNPLGAPAITQILSPLIGDSFSPAVRLQTLNITATNLGTKGGTVIAGFLRGNPTLKSLNLSNNNLGRGIKTLAGALAENDTLRHVNLSQNNLKSKGATTLVQALQANDNWQLKSIDISNNNIGEAGMRPFGEFLVLDRKLEGFFVGANDIGEEGAVYLANVLKHNYTLKRLGADNNKMGEYGSMVVVEPLKSYNTTLEYLDLSWNNMGEDAAIFLADTLGHNSQLKSLNMKGNDIGSIGATAFSEAFAYNEVLTKLDLSRNQITDEGAFALALSLAKPGCPIQMIDWSENNFTAEGSRALERIPILKWNYQTWLGDLLKSMAKGNPCAICLFAKKIADEEILLLKTQISDFLPKIPSFSFGGPLVTPRSLSHLATDALSCPSSIVRLYIRRTTFDNELLSIWSSSLEKNTILEVLSLTECKISKEGAQILAKGLAKNSSLRRLNLDRNPIEDSGAQTIMGTLPHPTMESLSLCYNSLSDNIMASEHLGTLRELNLCGNDITDKGALLLCNALIDGAKLSNLTLRYNCGMTERGGKTLKNFLPHDAILDY